MLAQDYQMNEIEENIASFIIEETETSAIVQFAKPLAGGGSRDTWLINALIGGESSQLVMRRDFETEIFEQTLTRAQEFTLLEVAHANGITVPRPRFLCMDATVADKPFFLMDYVEGVSIGVKVVNAPQLEPLHAHLPSILGQELAKIHQIDKQDPKLNFLTHPSEGRTAAEQALFETRHILDRLGIHNPTIEFGLRWLEQNAPADSELVVVHSDYRIGNFIVGEHGLHAIIDWEFTHIGDPHEDLAWGCVRDWRFGRGQKHFGGISDRETYVSAYEATSGRKIDRDVLDYWEIVGNMRWAVTCLSQADRYLSGGDASVEFASLGRRSSEMQLEFLRLIQEKGL